MTEYHKIQSIFKRDMENNGRFLMWQWTTDVFEYLADSLWICTEKIDGTNIRVIWDGATVEFKGRTDRAVIPLPLLEKLMELFPPEKMYKQFGVPDSSITLYGEGYGKKIQKGHNYIPDGVSFILFDIRISNWWLTIDATQEIAQGLDIDHVPVLGEFTLMGAINYVASGFLSNISANACYEAEGLVVKPTVNLLDRGGRRVITKIKTVDFQQFKR